MKKKIVLAKIEISEKQAISILNAIYTQLEEVNIFSAKEYREESKLLKQVQKKLLKCLKKTSANNFSTRYE